METTSVGLLIAFTAGGLSFLSPCVLPLIPSYMSFITGMSLDEMGEHRGAAFTHALLFVSGFTLIFLMLGATASSVGRLLQFHQVWLERFGGVLIIFFGLYLLGVFRLGALAQERRVHIQNKPLGYAGSVLVGVAFGAGWTPCIGPILGAILMYAGTQGSMAQGIVLLLFYSLGLAIPFLVAALAVERFIKWFQRYRQYMPLVTKASGGILLFLGLLLLSGYFSMLASWLQGLTPDFLRDRI
ncbi:MAG: sulfite exporter TauE/SafE family protein [Gemmatimonadetes bacterium]|nr:sulfite exporter TauE/SafE family protein [Gemmatimonadota bacterium]MCH7775039.1 sulfite exporter TauE/SafE family protein [Gemmatimonadota bacterium]MCH8144709.1 sulfite exporter TauE/SafE family protein [Gemmatimonadota bacterium]MCH8256033.1 sulfite exporter TauE/SafE family protein [Gemmatimonadota bacterium]MCH8934262.1 sulfite exporter TauE/SafE family protein [Gemmatimonadota bacterium]